MVSKRTPPRVHRAIHTLPEPLRQLLQREAETIGFAALARKLQRPEVCVRTTVKGEPRSESVILAIVESSRRAGFVVDGVAA